MRIDLNGLKFDGLTIWRTLDGYQANLRAQGSDGWTCETASTAEAALDAAVESFTVHGKYPTGQMPGTGAKVKPKKPEPKQDDLDFG